jgi:glycosyltransferase involved in cell wall biosynthesis
VPPLSGGATERSWYGLAKLFAAAGHSVTFISRAFPKLPDTQTEDGVNHIRVRGFDHTRYLALNLLLDAIWGVRAAQALPKGDVVVCNTVTLPIWLRRIKPQVGKVAVMIGRAPKGQVRFYGGVDRIYAPSSDLAGQVSLDWAFKRTKVIGYPIDWQLHASSVGQQGSPVTVGFVGRLHPEKGIALLIGAARILSERTDLPDWRLKIVGPGNVGQGGGGDRWLTELQKESAGTLGTRIQWVGPEFDLVRLARHYGEMDIFCYPSIAEKGETFGVSVAEAMASRCAVVVSALGCFSDLVMDGETGLVFNHRAGNPERLLADCIGRLLSDPDARKAIAVRGQQFARKFDYRAVAGIILDDLALLTSTPALKQQ